jgi:hypothetical protein
VIAARKCIFGEPQVSAVRSSHTFALLARVSRRPSREWLRLGVDLDKATDRVAAAQVGELDDALDGWFRVAMDVILCKSAPDLSMRTKVCLAAIIAGQKHHYGAFLDCEKNPVAVAFALLDQTLFSSGYAITREREAKARRQRKCRKHAAALVERQEA